MCVCVHITMVLTITLKWEGLHNNLLYRNNTRILLNIIDIKNIKQISILTLRTTYNNNNNCHTNSNNPSNYK